MKATPSIIENLRNEDTYDFIFLTVRENQVHQALNELRNNNSSNIVTMVNTIETYNEWERICGKGRIIPAFPGAGGSFDGNILKADLTPKFIQPTTFAEINGKKTERVLMLTAIFKQSCIPCQMVKDMHEWQICHLAMVVPIADAYYEADNPEKAGKESILIYRTAKRMKRNFITLHNLGIVLSPKKMNLFRFIPITVLRIGLRVIFQSDFGKMFMYQHSMKAPNEMRQLHRQLYQYIKTELER